MRKKTTSHHSRVEVTKLADKIEDVFYNLKETNSKLDVLYKNFNEFKNRVLEILDRAMGELKAILEEQTLITHKTSEYSDTLEDHKIRIEKLEQVTSP